jgi:hypothetical protein
LLPATHGRSVRAAGCSPMTFRGRIGQSGTAISRWHGATGRTRYLIGWQCREVELRAMDAYAELRSTEMVDAPNWIVTPFFTLTPHVS